MSTIKEKIFEIACSTFEIAPHQIEISSSARTVENWDSLKHIQFVLALEQEFQFNMTPEDINSIKSIEKTIQLIESKTS